jgi:8-oxo-dGTP pyrophosphatase MutT (NUDIX family)
MSVLGPPATLTMADVSINDVANDGWCLYRAYLTAWGIANQLAPPEDDNIVDYVHFLSQILLANVTVPQIKRIIDTQLQDVINGEHDEKGYATQVIEVDNAKPYIERNGHRFKYVKTETEYAEALAEFKEQGNFNSGPRIWPDLQVMGYVMTDPYILLLNENTGQLANIFTLDPTGKSYLILLHVGGNHYKYVLPRNPDSLPWYYKGGNAGGAGAGLSTTSSSASSMSGSYPGSSTSSSVSGSSTSGSFSGSSASTTVTPVTMSVATPASSRRGSLSQGQANTTTNDPLTTEQIKGYLKDLSGNPDPRAKKLQVILASILLINAVRTRKLKRLALQAKPAEKKAAVGDVSGRVVPIKPTRGMIEGAFNALGGFGKKAAALLQRKSKSGVSIRTGIEALRRGPADISRDFSRAPAAVQRIARPPTGPYIQAGVGSTAAKKETYAPLIPTLPEEFKAGSIVSTYIKVGDRLLIHRRAKGVADEQTISTPSGWVDASDGSYVAAAVREVKEESGLELQGAELMLLRVTQIDGKYMVAFYVERDALPDVPGPQPDFAKELDMKYDFAGISGQTAGAASGHFLADIAELPKWLRTNKEFKNRMFYDNLVALMLKFPDKFTIPEDAANDVIYDINALDARLSWVPKHVFSSQDLKDTWLCQFEQTRVSPCEPWELRDALIAADKFKEHDRLGAHLATNPDIVEYREMTNRIKALKESMKGPHKDEETKELRTLEKEFSDKYLQTRKVHVVRSLKPGDDYSEKTFTIPNPVHALSYREDEGTTFAKPTGAPSKYDPSGAMLAMNTDVLEAVAYPEMIADKHMAISILESLWYCAGDVSLSNEPRCFPARILGQLREYEAARVQLDQQQRAQEYMKMRTAWPEIKRIIRAMKNALVGAQVVSFSDALAEKIDIVPEVSTPVGSSVPGAASQQQQQPPHTHGVSVSASVIERSPAAITAATTAATTAAITAATTAATPDRTSDASKSLNQSGPGSRPRAMGSMARGVAVVVPRGIGAPFGFQSLLPTPLGASGR